MDLLGPFPLAKGQCKYLLVAVDYFTKWIEVEPLAIILANKVQKFLWKNIITRFNIPHTVIMDNGLQFTNKKLNDFMKKVQHNTSDHIVRTPSNQWKGRGSNKVIIA